MPQLSSPASTPAGMPLFNAAHISKAGGLFMMYATASDLATAVAAEGANWPDGQRAALSSEADSGAERIYRTSLGNARTVKIGPFIRTLTSDTAIVRATSGAPSSGVGANGDLAFDSASGVVYERPAGTWAVLASIYTSGASVTVPGAPTAVTATAGSGSVSVAFTAPASNGGAAITGYRVTLSTGQTATGSASPISVSAPSGTPVTATVQAQNSAGYGAASSASNSVTPTAPVSGAPVLALNGMPLILNNLNLVMV